MQIYSGQCAGWKKDRCKELKIGFMFSSSPTALIKKCHGGIDNYCLDNGAFSTWKTGLPFDEYSFLKSIMKLREHKYSTDFIVLPDLIGKGKKSLEFSANWANRLPYDNWAMVIHPGITQGAVKKHIDKFATLFIGGPDNPEWKWDIDNCKKWIDFGLEHGKSVHMGACGSLDELLFCHSLGFDSVDSTNFVINDQFHVIEEYYKQIMGLSQQNTLFDLYN